MASDNLTWCSYLTFAYTHHKLTFLPLATLSPHANELWNSSTRPPNRSRRAHPAPPPILAHLRPRYIRISIFDLFVRPFLKVGKELNSPPTFAPVSARRKKVFPGLQIITRLGRIWWENQKIPITCASTSNGRRTRPYFTFVTRMTV